MGNFDDTIIVGKLNDKELRDSIDKLVKHVDNQSLKMAQSFDAGIKLMKESLQSLGATRLNMGGLLGNSISQVKNELKEFYKVADDLQRMMSKASQTRGGGSGTSTSTSSNSGAQSQTSAEDNTIAALKEQIRLEKEKLDLQKLGTRELQAQNARLAERKNRLQVETQNPHSVKVSKAIGTKATTESELEGKLKNLEQLQARYADTTKISTREQERLTKAIEQTKQALEKLRPKTIEEIKKMDESSVDAISAKLKALKSVKINNDGSAESIMQARNLQSEYKRLSKLQGELIGQNRGLTLSNTALGRSFGYIRNRLVYALSIGLVMQFTKQIINIRAQYELLERSIGVLVGSFEKGTKIFNELNEMALKSPFTLLELGTAAKQLTAYNFAANEVVDTTRRLADISAALGVPMERLTYNLGQIKAQGVLNARDARDFANAGLAIVPALSKMYTEQKRFGEEAVTTAKVYDMMSKKLVTYHDVLQVLTSMTDEGGKFFDFQAKQAETLKVQLNNLTLAMNNMFNEMGAGSQGWMIDIIKGTKTLFKNWREVASAIQSVITGYGVIKTATFLIGGLGKGSWGALNVSVLRYIAGIKSATGFTATFNAVMSSNAVMFFATALASVASYFLFFKNSAKQASEAVTMFGESGAKTLNRLRELKQIIGAVNEGTGVYKKSVSELNQLLQEYGVTEIKNREEINEKIKTTIELVEAESAARQRANMLEQAQKDREETNDESIKDFKNELDSYKFSDQVKGNVNIIAPIAQQMILDEIDNLKGKSGQELAKAYRDLAKKIATLLQEMGLSKTRGDVVGLQNELFYLIQNMDKASKQADFASKKAEEYYQKSKQINKSNTTFAQKVDANARALRNASEDALQMYNRVYEIVKIAKGNHIIHFDLELSAKNPPKWMLEMGKNSAELRALSERFIAIAQSGGHAEGYTRETTYQRGLEYAAAAKEMQMREERKAQEKDKGGKTRANQKDVVLEALKEEISLVKKLQGEYNTLANDGYNSTNALNKVSKEFESTITHLNTKLAKLKLPKLDVSEVLGKKPEQVAKFFENIKEVLSNKGLSNLERMTAVEDAIREFALSGTKDTLSNVDKELASSIERLDNNFNIALEIEETPDLGEMFLNSFDIDKGQLTTSIDAYADAYVKILNEAFAKRGDKFKISSLTSLTKDDIAQIKKRAQEPNSDISKKSADDLEKAWKNVEGKQIQKATETRKNIVTLTYELSDIKGKIAIEQDKLAKMQEDFNNTTDAELKRLKELEIQKQEDVISALQEDVLQMLPTYKKLFGDAVEHGARVQRKLATSYLKMLRDAEAKGANKKGEYEITDATDPTKKTSVNKKTLGKEIDRANKELAKTESIWKKIRRDFTATEDGTLDWEQGLKDCGAALNNIAQNANSIVSAFETIGISVSEDMQTAIQGIGQMGEGLSKMASSNPIDQVTGAIETAIGLGNTLSGVFGWGKKDYFQQTKAEFEELSKIIEKTSEMWTKALEKTSGPAAVAQYQKMIKYNEKLVELAHKEAKEAGESGSGVGSRSYAKRTNRRMNAEDWAQISKYAGQTITSVQQMYNLEPTKLKEIMMEMPDVWKKIDVDIRESFENLIDLGEKAEEYAKAFQEAIINISFESVSQDFENLLQNADVKLKDFQDAFVQYLRNSIVRMLMTQTYNKELENWTTQYQKLAEDGMLSSEDARILKERWDDIARRAIEDMKNATSMLGGDANLSALQQGIQGITESTASALEAYMNGVSQQVYAHTQLLTEIRDAVQGVDSSAQLGALTQILFQAQQSYQVQQSIQSILEGALTPSGRGFNVQLLD